MMIHGRSVWLVVPAVLGAGFLLLSQDQTTPRTLHAGPGQEYSTISEAAAQVQAGDTVVIAPGVYKEAVLWTGGELRGKPIVVRGASGERPVIDGAGMVLSGSGGTPRALFQVQGDNFVFENLEFRNGRNDKNAAGIRVLDSKLVTIRHVKVTGCDMGIFSSRNGDIVIEHSEIAYNGTPLFNGFAHNIYLSGGDKAVVRFCYIHDSTTGENFKSRSRYTELMYNYIADAHDGFQGGQPTKEIGFPQGERTEEPNSHAVMVGNVIVKRGDGWGFIEFGPEGEKPARNGTLFMINNTIIREGESQKWILNLSHGDERAVLHNNIFYGTEDFVRGEGAGNITGSRNWFPTGAAVPAGLEESMFGQDPGFVDLRRRDYRLRPGSPGLDAGLMNPTSLNHRGETVITWPNREYRAHLDSAERLAVDSMDLGALGLSQHLKHLTDTVAIQGRVVDGAGTPLTHRMVTLFTPPAQIARRSERRGREASGPHNSSEVPAAVTVHASTITDDQGNFQIAGLPRNRTMHVAAWPDVVPLAPAEVSAETTADTNSLEFREPVLYTIRGKITGSNQEPVGGAAVFLAGPKPRWTYADADGEYEFTEIPGGGPYDIRPYRSVVDFDIKEKSIELLTSDTVVDFSGRFVYRISGSVTDADGKGVRGVVMSLEGGVSQTATTNNIGSYAFSRVPHGLAYTIAPPASLNFQPQVHTIDALSENTSIDFSGPARQVLTGTVTDAAGAPIGRAKVELRGPIPLTFMTADDGTFSFDVLSGGSYEITVSKKGYTFATPTVVISNLTGPRNLQFVAQ